MDTIAACGDVNRNVMCNPNPYLSEVHAEILKISQQISDHLTPATRAYHEIWLDGEKVESTEEDFEPIYGKTYLPRKFKITIAVPPSNDVDIYANCLSFIAIVEQGKLVGFNVAVGGGMGMTHGAEDTYPRLADVIGFCTVAQVGSATQASEFSRSALFRWLSLIPYCSRNFSISGRFSADTFAIIRFWFAVRRKSPSWIFAISRRPVRIG